MNENKTLKVRVTWEQFNEAINNGKMVMHFPFTYKWDAQFEDRTYDLVELQVMKDHQKITETYKVTELIKTKIKSTTPKMLWQEVYQLTMEKQ